MKQYRLQLVREREIPLKHDIQTLGFYKENQLVILTKAGEVMLYDMAAQSTILLCECSSVCSGFDPAAKSSVYTLDDIIVIVNDFKTQGLLINRKEEYRMSIGRTDYHADISQYPVALFRNEAQEPCMIYGTAWNEIHIANLATRQILTADKSLIEVGAEQRHIDFYKKHEERNKFMWPRAFDYFYGKLILSPDQRSFVSAGWVWGSADCCMHFELQDFIENHRIKAEQVGCWEHNGRGLCFLDNDTIAVLCNPYLDDEDDAVKDAPYEIRLYCRDGGGEKQRIILEPSLDLKGAELYYLPTEQCFLSFAEASGVVLISPDGETVMQEKAQVPDYYDDKRKYMVNSNGKSVTVYTLSTRQRRGC